MAKKTHTIADSTTEEKIKQAARKVFMKKGFSGTRTRDIAEEAGINLALLNYYFRSKEKLFDMIMMENMQHFIMAMKGVLNNKKISLEEMVSTIVENYTVLLLANPDLPIFIFSEIKANPDKLAANIGVKSVLMESHFFRLIKSATKSKVNPLHFVINIIGLTVFPFIAGPLLQNIGNLKQNDFNNIIEERKKMIPAWIDSMLKVR